ncbi:MAG: hypothetical protein JSV83_24240 [Desulfobacterales bacterium]|nr:MAG: hypothetical protein JSV83_24240 [Desulfobacterales bacterium]
MPRKSRIDAQSALQHVIINGLEGKAIFKDADRKIGGRELIGDHRGLFNH